METKKVETIGERLKYLRVSRNLTQQELACKLNYGSRSMISDLEIGRRFLNAQSALDYAKEFGVTLDWLFYGTGVVSSAASKSEIDELLEVYFSIRDLRLRQIAVEQIRLLGNGTMR